MATDPLSEEPSPGSRYAQRSARGRSMSALNRRLNPSAVRGMSSAECADAFTGFRINITVTLRASTLLRAPERPEGPKEEEHAVR